MPPLSVAVERGADRIYVLPTGYACALRHLPRSALGVALHALTLAIQRRLIDDVLHYQQSVDLRVVPPLCPLDVGPTDFTQADTLLRRAREATHVWLAMPRAADQSQDLGLHEHAAVPSSVA